jgi:precorrin-8X/cobalt-precorrin-8 methylmutase
VIVDWSAANQPKTGRDSIWIACRRADEETIANPPTRAAAQALLADLIAQATKRGERVLLGFDFPFGYPEGFAARLGLAGPPWRALWEEIARLVEDRPDNRNNRFAVAAELNRRVSQGGFPFWGCPERSAGPYLGAKHHRRHDRDGLAERRVIDEWMVGAQPCWKLLGAGSVGGQVLTGIPVVRALRDDPRWADDARIWPFETGLSTPEPARIVFAEVWPSWWDWKTTRDGDEIADRAQVRHVARLFAARARAGDLAAWFTPPVDPREHRRIVGEEAWTLGVIAPRRPAISQQSASPAAAGDGPPASGMRRARKTPSPPAGRGERAEVRGAVLPRNAGNNPHPPIADAMGPSLSRVAGEGHTSLRAYLKDPVEIYRRSFAMVRAEADLSRFPPVLRPLALRLAHAAGDASILRDLAWSRGAVAAGQRALAAGGAILADSTMVAAGITSDRLPAHNLVICTLHDAATPGLATQLGTTRSAAAVELWRPSLAGAVVAIGNAPTALFHLLDMIAAGAPRPAAVLGFPVGFVGAAEAKAALAAFGRGLAYVTLHGRRGGSALAAAAVNALALGTDR